MRKLSPLIGILCVLITSCTKEDEKDVSIAVKEIKLSNDKGTIEVGKTIQLTASVLPENATDKTIIFTSSKEDIATVNETGLVSGLTEGQTIISATNGTITENCIITVNTAFIHLTGIDLPNPIISLIEGDTFQLEPVFFPKDASDKTVKYYSVDLNFNFYHNITET